MIKVSLALFLWMAWWGHAFHISVTEILYKPEDKVVQVSVRLFLDDLELALRAETGNQALDIADKSNYDYLSEAVGKYVKKRLRVSSKKPIPLTYLGFEYEEDVLWCYLESEKVKKFEAIKVENELLTEAFSDQENLVHFRRGGKVKSVRLSPELTNATMDLGPI